MVCDRAQVSMIYIVFGRVWPKLEYILYAFFIIDYGAHYLQFNSNALTKNTSHKDMKDPNENFLVKLYYTNFAFFATLAIGADTALVYGVCFGNLKNL
jgi:hypothetical protein